MTDVGHAPSKPQRFTRAEWLAVFKRTVTRFLDDDCLGLAKQIAYSSLLAFFPAVVALVGLLDLIGAYDTLQRFLDPVAPKAVVELIKSFRHDTRGGGSLVAFLVGAVGAVWAASGAMGRSSQRSTGPRSEPETRPFWKVRLVALVLVTATVVVAAGTLLLVVLGGTLGDAIAAKANLGGGVHLGLEHRALAARVRRRAPVLRLDLLPRARTEQRRWRWLTAGSMLGALMWLALSGLFALYTAFSDSYSKTYGTLAGGIVLLLWLNYSAWAILFGAELNAELAPKSRR